MSTLPTSISPRPRLTREDILDGRDVAELLHLPISTVLEYARRGLLPGRKLGRRWIFLRDEIEAAVRSGPEGQVGGVRGMSRLLVEAQQMPPRPVSGAVGSSRGGA